VIKDLAVIPIYTLAFLRVVDLTVWNGIRNTKQQMSYKESNPSSSKKKDTNKKNKLVF